jgi:hypothetical protein
MDESATTKDNYRGFEGDLSFSAYRRDETIRFDVYGGGGYFHDAPPQSLKNLGYVGGSASFREIFGVPFALQTSADWSLVNEESGSAEFNDPAYEDVEVAGMMTYMWSNAGIVLMYDHLSSDYVYPTWSSDEASHSASALSHLTLPNGYLRIGAGGGIWDEKMQFLGSDEGASRGAEVHGRIEGRFSPLDWMDVSLSAKVFANYSDGMFIGWYPSWSVTAGVRSMFENVSIALGGSVDGHYRDLNYIQEKNKYGTNLNVTYSPADYLNASIAGSYTKTKQASTDDYDSSMINVSALWAFRFIDDPQLWLKLTGTYMQSEYEAQADNVDKYHFLIGVVSLEFKD